MAAVAPTAFGGDSFCLVAKQTAKNTKNTTLIQNKYPLADGSDLRQGATSITPDYFTGVSGPSKPFPGPANVEGSLIVPLGDTHSGIWLKYLTGDLTGTTTTIAGGNITAAAAYTANTALTIGSNKDPADIITEPGVDNAKISVTLAGSATGAGNVVIKGTGQLDNPVEETLSWTSANAVGTHTTTKYFKTITSITPGGSTAGGTMKTDVVSPGFKHVLKVKEQLSNGLTVEVVKGDVPMTYDSVQIASASIDIAEWIAMTLGCVGRRAYNRQNVAAGANASSTTGFSTFSGNVHLNYYTLFQIDDEVFPLISATLDFDQNLENAERYYRSLYSLGVQRAAGPRTASISADIDWSKANDFDSKANGTEIKATLSTANLPNDGAHNSITFEFPKAVLTDYPDAALVAGAIPQTLAISAFTTGSEGEMEITVINQQAAADFE